MQKLKAKTKIKSFLKRALFRISAGYHFEDVREIVHRSSTINRFLLSSGDQILEPFRVKGVIFVHVPRNRGTSVSRALYGRGIKHYSARFYRDLDRNLFNSTPSFALIRDPIDRFVSAYHFINQAGTQIVPLDPHWVKIYGNPEQLRHLHRLSNRYSL